MKLQIDAGQAAAFALQAGPYTNLGEATQTVLNIFHLNGHDPYTRRDVLAVITAMGGPEDPLYHVENGVEGWRIINPLVKGERHDEGKGYYTQKNRPAIATKPVTPAAVAEAHAEEHAELAARGVVVETVPGLVWMPEDLAADESREGWYREDEGLRQIAVSQSKCFGSYVSGNSACKVCPLARWCAASGLSGLDDVAADLDKQTEKEIREAERAYENARLAAEAAAKAAARAAAAPRAPTPTPAPARPSPAPTSPLGWPNGYKEVPLPFDGVCSECDGMIQGGSQGVHLSGVGMLHLECARKRIARNA